MKNWKTTTAAILTVVSVVATQLAAQWDNDPTTTANWQLVVPVIITAGGLICSKDSDK